MLATVSRPSRGKLLAPADATSLRPFAALVALADRRLTTSTAGRVGAAGVVLVALLASLEILATPSGRDAAAAAVGASVLLLWLGAGPAILAAAGGQGRRDEEEGIVLLARLRGHQAPIRSVARILGTTLLVLRRVGALAIVLCLLGAARADSLAGLPRRLAGLTGFALMAGIALGAVAEACARLGSRRATSLMVALIVVPWALAPQLGHPRLSIPGALGWALDCWTGTSGALAAPMLGWGAW